MEKNYGHFVSVDSKYIDYLKNKEISKRGYTCVPNVNYGDGRKDKPFYGYVWRKGPYHYYVPISHSKNITSTSVAIYDSKADIVGTLKFKYMIPIPLNAIKQIDFQHVQDTEYKTLLFNEWRYCTNNHEMLTTKAGIIYDAVIRGLSPELAKRSVDFKLAEEGYTEWWKNANALLKNQEVHEAKDLSSELVGTAIANMGLRETITTTTGMSYYDSLQDSIGIPKRNLFKTEYAYNMAIMHELVHATSHQKRLNRNIYVMFGESDYRYESLIADKAELSSLFKADKDGLAEYNVFHDYQHRDVEHFYETLPDSTKELIMKEAAAAKDYVALCSGLLSLDKYNQMHEEHKLGFSKSVLTRDYTRNNLVDLSATQGSTDVRMQQSHHQDHRSKSFFGKDRTH